MTVAMDGPPGVGATAQPAPAAVGLRRLEPGSLQLRRGPRGEVRLLLPDRCHLAVTLTRAFPLSRPGGWIAIRERDGAEVGLLPDGACLDPESRTCAEEELRLRYFTPTVTAILDIRDVVPGGRGGGAIWELETDRGPATLHMPNTNEHVQTLPDGRILLTDRAGNRYEIAGLGDLDPASRRRLAQFVWL